MYPADAANQSCLTAEGTRLAPAGAADACFYGTAWLVTTRLSCGCGGCPPSTLLLRAACRDAWLQIDLPAALWDYGVPASVGDLDALVLSWQVQFAAGQLSSRTEFLTVAPGALWVWPLAPAPGDGALWGPGTLAALDNHSFCNGGPPCVQRWLGYGSLLDCQSYNTTYLPFWFGYTNSTHTLSLSVVFAFQPQNWCGLLVLNQVNLSLVLFDNNSLAQELTDCNSGTIQALAQGLALALTSEQNLGPTCWYAWASAQYELVPASFSFQIWEQSAAGGSQRLLASAEGTVAPAPNHTAGCAAFCVPALPNISWQSTNSTLWAVLRADFGLTFPGYGRRLLLDSTASVRTARARLRVLRNGEALLRTATELASPRRHPRLLSVLALCALCCLTAMLACRWYWHARPAGAVKKVRFGTVCTRLIPQYEWDPERERDDDELPTIDDY